MDSESNLIIFVVGFLGLLFGSFANVVIYRLPLGLSVVSPRSSCPNCQKMISALENIPVMSWLFLRGRCGGCQKPISWRYPLVELIMGLLFAGVILLHGVSWTSLEYLIFVFGLVTVSFIDFDHYILPDVFTLSGIVLGLLGAMISPERAFGASLGGVLLGGGFLWAIAAAYMALRKQEGMGGGDIKLLAWIGAVLGWTSIPFVILFASLTGTIVGVTLGFRKGEVMQSSIPFGPYLSLGALVYIFGGDEVGLWYIRSFIHLP